jgi:hypothetical protein
LKSEYLAARDILFHENNQTVWYVLAGFTSRSPEMMEELGRLLFFSDNNNIHIMPRNIKYATDT